MALKDSIEFLKDGRSIRIGSPVGKTGKLRYRVIDLRSHADSDAKIEFKSPKEIIDLKMLCVVELTNGEERLLVSPQKTGAKPKLLFLDGTPRFKLNDGAPSISLSRLWLQYEPDGPRFYLGNMTYSTGMKWSYDRDSRQPSLYMDDYCKAYYEGI